jgi:tetraacyldisaccharide 4'-kinase
VFDVASGDRLALSTLAEKRGAALTAIANPTHFFSLLESLGMNLSAKIAFRDHHRFSRGEWKKALAVGKGCVLTTEKDAVKLRGFVDKNRQLLCLALKARFVSEQQEVGFFKLLESKLEPRGASYEETFER